jgi:ATP-dependent DNA helicase RecG
MGELSSVGDSSDREINNNRNMSLITKHESHDTEFKSAWKDEYLRQICGFANANGGKMYIGIDDYGHIEGVQNSKKLLEDIPNKGMNLMGLLLNVTLHSEDNKNYVIITIPESHLPVSLRGKYYYRNGTTTQEITGNALYDFLYKKQNITWDGIGVRNASLADIDKDTIIRFVELSIAANRLSNDARNQTILQLFKHLNLLDDEQHIKRAALLAFASEPCRFFPSMYLKIGKFISDIDVVSQDVIEDNLFRTIEKTMDILKTKYLKTEILYKGIHREEKLEYPETALREAILNAIVHRDYSGTFSQIRIYNNSLQVWNAGKLPGELTIEMLYKQHASVPRNRELANLFFRAGYIEAWGRGTLTIVNSCKEMGIPLPAYTEQFGGLSVKLSKSPGKNVVENEKKILTYISLNPNISAKKMAGKLKLTDRTVQRYLKSLQDKHIVRRIGPAKGGHWEIVK